LDGTGARVRPVRECQSGITPVNATGAESKAESKAEPFAPLFSGQLNLWAQCVHPVSSARRDKTVADGREVVE